MKIVENEKVFSFDVSGYQYEEYSNEYDGNWLMLEFSYADKEVKNIGHDPCILTWEIDNMIDDLKSILNGKKSCFISDFLEPYLKLVVIKHGETYSLATSFYYYPTADDCRSWELSQELSKNNFAAWIKEWEDIMQKYPIREVEKGK